MIQKLKGRTRPLVSIGNSSNSNSNKSNDNHGHGDSNEEKPFCPFFNGVKGCSYGARCWKQNKCIECKNKRHGAATCFRIGRHMIDI